MIVAALNVGGLRAGAGAPTDAGSERPAGREGDRRAEQRGTPLRGPARLVKQPVRHSARDPSRELSDEGLRLRAQGATHADGNACSRAAKSALLVSVGTGRSRVALFSPKFLSHVRDGWAPYLRLLTYHRRVKTFSRLDGRQSCEDILARVLVRLLLA